MEIIAEIVDENVADTVRRAALAADQAVVLATPVDTGRARANWVTSVGAPDYTTSESTDPSGSSAIAQGQRAVGGYKAGAGGIFITNSLPYIARLEDGYSKQAPGGMTKFALQAAQQQLQRGGALLRGV